MLDIALGVKPLEWSVTLDSSESDALRKILTELPYLGRAESVCLAELVADYDAPQEGWIGPVEIAEQWATPVLVARQPLDVSQLVVTPAQTRRAGQLLPMGSAWEYYASPSPHLPTPRPVHTSRSITTMRFRVTSRAQPSVREALTYAEIFRRAALRNAPAPAPAISGHSEGSPGPDMQPRHQHAHYLALDLDGDLRVDTLAIWTPRGLTNDEVSRLGRVTGLYGHVHLTSFRPAYIRLESCGEASKALGELAEPARVWESHTPYSPTRHVRRGQDLNRYLYDDVSRELSFREKPKPATVTLVERRGWPTALQFRRHRIDESLRQPRPAWLLRVEFEDDVAGPLLLGRFSHFGLGIFLPVR